MGTEKHVFQLSKWRSVHGQILKKKLKEKRMNKTTSQDKRQRKLQGSELTIQRLLAEVSGKAQKYSRVGPESLYLLIHKRN
jgi:hypothetical protein